MVDVLEVPLETQGDVYDYLQTIVLEGSVFFFRFLYNARTEIWKLTIETEEGEEIITGQSLVMGFDLLRRSTSENRPPGTLYVLPYSLVRETPGLLIGEGSYPRLFYNASV